MYPADFGIKGTPMALRQNRGRAATATDTTTGQEHYIITCNYFQLQGTEGEQTEPPLKGVQDKAKQPVISAGEGLEDKALNSLEPQPQLRKRTFSHVSDTESESLWGESDRPLLKGRTVRHEPGSPTH